MNFEIIKRRPYGLLVSTDGGIPRVWVLAKLRSRQHGSSHHCALCKKAMHKGVEAWKTVENALYRSARVCTTCWSK